MVFTEINPTSTTTTILLVYEPGYPACCAAKTFTLGPYTVLRHDTTPSTPTPPATQPPAQGAQPTQTIVSAETPSSSITSLSPALPSPSICESLLAVFLVIFRHSISINLSSGHLAISLPVCYANTAPTATRVSSTFQTVKSVQPPPTSTTTSTTRPSSEHHLSATDIATILGAVFGTVIGGVTLVVTAAMCWMQRNKR